MKGIYDYELGEVVENIKALGFGADILKSPIKLVKISYTFQDSNATQMQVARIHEDFVDEDEQDGEEANGE